MRTFTTLWRRELISYFYSPIAYVVLVFFLLIMGASFWMLVTVLIEGPTSESVMRILFGESIFFWLAMLAVTPILTMRLLAEEKRSGTIETLLTAPVRDTDVVLAKYAGALFFFVFMWLPTIAYAYILQAFSPEAITLDPGPVWSAYLGAFLVGGFFISVGLFASSITRNQVIAAITSFAIVSALFFTGFAPYFVRDPLLQEVTRYLSPVLHMMDFSRGAVDSRPVVLYLSLTVFMLFLTVKVVESRNWKT